MSIANRIGVSTITMVGIDVLEAIRMIREAGFRAIELWSADFQGVSGYPLQPAAGVWPRSCPPERRRELRRELEGFETRIFHVQLYGADVAALNPGIREESRRQYLECLDLGLELGCDHVTYHHGTLGDVLGANGPARREEAWAANVSMGQELVERSAGSGLLLGYENGPIRRTLELTEAVGSERFGLLLDVAHAAMAAPHHNTDGILEEMDLCRGKLVEVHTHGLWNDVCVLRDHQDLSKNNCLDYGRVMPKLRDLDFAGPCIFEVCAPTPADVVERCAEFKQHLIDCHDAANR